MKRVLDLTNADGMTSRRASRGGEQRGKPATLDLCSPRPWLGLCHTCAVRLSGDQ